MNTSINTSPHLESRRLRLRRGVVALAAVTAMGLGAGAVTASNHPAVDVPDEWPDPVRQRANAAAAFCADPAAAAAAGYTVIVGAGFITGTPMNDLILASGIADTIRARAGNDIVCAFGQNDRVTGDAGDDVIFGQEGNDRLRGNAGDDILIGGPGADLCDGGPGTDFVDC